MKNFLRLFLKVIGSYTLEERVISVIALLLVVFILAKDVTYVINPAKVFAEKGSYNEAIINDKPTLLNPLFVDYAQANRDISALVFSGLMKYDSSLANFVNDLGILTISEDYKEYLFKLREDVLWQDGTAFNADDVIFTYQDVIQNPTFQNKILKANFEGVKVEKINDFTVKFILERPNSFFVTNLNTGILPKHLLEGVDPSLMASNPFNLNPIGTGPYKTAGALEFLDDGKQKVQLKLFENYYGVKPKINEIRFKIYPDEDSLKQEIGSTNVIPKLPQLFSDIAKNERFDLKEYMLPQYTAVFMNLQDDLLKDSKLRLALVKSIDKSVLLQVLADKVPVDTPLMELNQENWNFKPNAEEASGALFDLGYKFEKDDKGELIPGQIYRKDKNGKELLLTVTVKKSAEGTLSQQETDKTVNFLIDSWKKVGVKVDPIYLDDYDYMTVLSGKNYQMVLAGQSLGYNLDTFPYWHSSQAKEGGFNLSNYKNFAADQQIEKLRNIFDQEEKMDRINKLAKIISDDLPAIFLYRPKFYFATDGKLKNISLNNLDYPADRYSQIATWCLGDAC